MTTGIKFCCFLTLAFAVLQFIGIIEWGWLWVLSPLWLPTLIILAINAIASFAIWLGNREYDNRQ